MRARSPAGRRPGRRIGRWLSPGLRPSSRRLRTDRRPRCRRSSPCARRTWCARRRVARVPVRQLAVLWQAVRHLRAPRGSRTPTQVDGRFRRLAPGDAAAWRGCVGDADCGAARPRRGSSTDRPRQRRCRYRSVAQLTDTLSAVQFTRAMVGTRAAGLGRAVRRARRPTRGSPVSRAASVRMRRLLLSNVDTAQASVDVSIWGGQGGAPTVRRGIVVAAQTQVVGCRSIRSTRDCRSAVVHVSATAGRVVPALRADTENGSIPLGRRLAAADRGSCDDADGAGDSRRRRLAAVGCWRPGRARCDLFTDGRDVGRCFRADRLHLADSRRWRRVAESASTPSCRVRAAAIVVTSTQPVVVGGISTLPPDGTGASDFAFTGAAAAVVGANCRCRW